MYIRKVKRKCGIRGCKNTDCFAVSRAREVGNTVIICRDCLKDALGSIESLEPSAKEVSAGGQNKPKKVGVKNEQHTEKKNA